MWQATVMLALMVRLNLNRATIKNVVQPAGILMSLIPTRDLNIRFTRLALSAVANILRRPESCWMLLRYCGRLQVDDIVAWICGLVVDRLPQLAVKCSQFSSSPVAMGWVRPGAIIHLYVVRLCQIYYLRFALLLWHSRRGRAGIHNWPSRVDTISGKAVKGGMLSGRAKVPMLMTGSDLASRVGSGDAWGGGSAPSYSVLGRMALLRLSISSL